MFSLFWERAPLMEATTWTPNAASQHQDARNRTADKLHEEKPTPGKINGQVDGKTLGKDPTPQTRFPCRPSIMSVLRFLVYRSQREILNFGIF